MYFKQGDFKTTQIILETRRVFFYFFFVHGKTVRVKMYIPVSSIYLRDDVTLYLKQYKPICSVHVRCMYDLCTRSNNSKKRILSLRYKLFIALSPQHQNLVLIRK